MKSLIASQTSGLRQRFRFTAFWEGQRVEVSEAAYYRTLTMQGQMSGVVTSTSGWPSLARFSAVKDPRGDYTRRGYGGVSVDHFGVRKFNSKNSAFIRRGANGNVLVFERHGDKLKALSPINPAHVLHHHETYDVVSDAFNARMAQRYESKLFGALSRFK